MSRTAPAPSRAATSSWTALAVTCCSPLAAGLRGRHRRRGAAADGVVTWTDGFDGTTLDARWTRRQPRPGHRRRSRTARCASPASPATPTRPSTPRRTSSMLDVPAGDFTATADVSRRSSRRSTRAPASSRGRTWTTTSGPGSPSSAASSPSGIAIETDVETGACLQRGVLRRPARPPAPSGSACSASATRSPPATGPAARLGAAGSTTVSFDTTQVGLYALAAQDGTVLPAAFDSFTIEHAPGADVVPAGPVRAPGDRRRAVPRGRRRRARR